MQSLCSADPLALEHLNNHFFVLKVLLVHFLQKLDFRNMTARQQVFHELVQTESNYTAILKTIIEVFKQSLENPSSSAAQLINQTEIKIIFGNLPPIYDIHSKMLAEFYQVPWPCRSFFFCLTSLSSFLPLAGWV